MPRDHRYWVYIMSSVTGALYIGMTSRLAGRVRDHKLKRGGGHAAKYNTTCLVYYEEFQYVTDPILREKELKAWRREKKTDLINAENPRWDDLAADWYDVEELAAAALADATGPNERRDSSFVGMTKEGEGPRKGVCIEVENRADDRQIVLDDESRQPTLYSVGHSNQSMDEFLGLLQLHDIEVLVDVRSAPYSRFVPQYNHASLKEAIVAAGMRYVYLGKELGGRPDDIAFYDSDGRADYRMISGTPLFQEGIDRLRRGGEMYRVAMMCSEEDPTVCHRRLLISRVIESQGHVVGHIRGDGRIDLEADLRDTPVDQPKQTSLFGDDRSSEETPEWKSTRSVLPRSLRDSSSDS
jgi:predicted GIY-YIG superfamily endonuclease